MPSRPGWRTTLQHREFRWLWLADLQSAVGDQVARVALAVLVYDTTRSAAATAAVYALTFLPAVVGAALLGHLVDRTPPKRLLVASDITRAALIGVMAIPVVPLGVLICALVLAVVISSPFQAAESSLTVRMFDRERYSVAAGIRGASEQVAQLAGFPVGGLIVALIHARPALAIDAASYAISAALLAATLTARPVEPASIEQADPAEQGWRRGVTAVTHHPQLPVLLGLAALVGFYVVPEALAAPLVDQHGQGPRTLGLLLAAIPLGNTLGTLAITRFVSDGRRHQMLPYLAGITAVPLILSTTNPSLTETFALWFVVGLLASYLAQVKIEFMRAVSPAFRGQAASIAAATVLTAQGVGSLLGGALARIWSITGALTVTGITATLAAAGLAYCRHTAHPPRPAAHPGGHIPKSGQPST